MGSGVRMGVDWSGPPWHCAQERWKTALPCVSTALSLGSGSGSGVTPAPMAAERVRTCGFENSSRWNEARSSSSRCVGAFCISAWFRSAPSACSCRVPRRASSWNPPPGFGPRGHEIVLLGPVSFTSLTVGTERQTSTEVSADGWPLNGSISLTLDGSGMTTRISPFCLRLLKSFACTPLVRKSSASIGRNSGSSARGFHSRRHSRFLNRASTLAGDNWN